MTAAELVNSLQANGIGLIPEGGTLRVRGNLTPDLRAALKAQKAEVLALIGAAQPVPGPCHWCGASRWWRSIYGRLICGQCHPPGGPELVAGRVGEGA